MKRRWVVVLVFAAAMLLDTKADDQGCRALDAAILYRHDATHRFYPDAAVVLNVTRLHEQTLIVISVPKRTARGVGTVFLRSLDFGRRWMPTPEIASPLALPGVSPAEAPSDNRVRYRFNKSRQVYLRSVNGGRSWLIPKNDIGNVSLDNFARERGGRSGWEVAFSLAAIHPAKPLVVFATVRNVHTGKGIKDIPPPLDMGLYRSDDGAEHWTPVNDAIEYGTPVGIDPSNPALMLAQARSGVVKTTDGGVSWHAVGQQHEMENLPAIAAGDNPSDGRATGAVIPLEVKQFAIDPGSGRFVFIVTNKGVYRSSDGGNTWCLLDVGGDFIDSTYSLAFDPLDASRLFIGTRFGVMYSEDWGAHFRRIYSSSTAPLSMTSER